MGAGVHGEHSRAGTVLNPDVTPGGKEGTQARVLQVEGTAYLEVFIPTTRVVKAPSTSSFKACLILNLKSVLKPQLGYIKVIQKSEATALR